MSVTPLDSTDQRLIRLVSYLGDPLVETEALADELSIGYQETQTRLEMLEEHGWVARDSDGGRQRWQVSSKASLLLRSDDTAPVARSGRGESDDIIEAEDEPEPEDENES
ncbi:MAG: hypothetical protein ACOCUO_03630 [archaeon]